ncbi:MAG TPA: response regulator [Myxococcaceae bacterium]|nr:response regulator [Myxococcaceae bacterium]
MSFKDLSALLQEDAQLTKADGAPRPHILVIDDDETIRKSLAALFGKRYTVVLAASAQEGLAVLSGDIRVAIVDVKMKGHDGFWACNELRKVYPELPVIFYSAYQDLKDPYQIINEHRPFGYLTKDGDRRRLVEAVDMAVRLSGLTREAKQLVDSLREP